MKAINTRSGAGTWLLWVVSSGVGLVIGWLVVYEFLPPPLNQFGDFAYAAITGGILIFILRRFAP